MKKIVLLVSVSIALIFLVGCTQQTVQQAHPGQIQQPPSQVNEQPAATGSASVVISDFAFKPNELTVKKGTTVTWVQKDSVSHTATSDNGKFDSGLLPEAASWSFTFTEAGEFPYHCTPHPSMKGTIIVE